MTTTAGALVPSFEAPPAEGAYIEGVCNNAVHSSTASFLTCARLPVAGSKQLLVIGTSADDALQPSNVSGAGLAWSLVKTIQPFINVRLSLYEASASAGVSATGAVTVDFSAVQFDFMYSWCEVANPGALGIIQSKSALYNGDSDYISVVMDAFQKTTNQTFACVLGAAGSGAPASTTPGDGFNEIHDQYVGDGSSYTVVMQTESKDSFDILPDATFSATAYKPAIIAIEIDSESTLDVVSNANMGMDATASGGLAAYEYLGEGSMTSKVGMVASATGSYEVIAKLDTVWTPLIPRSNT